MIAKIIVLKKLARRLSSFDYSIPENLASKIILGQLVEIPFRNREEKGIISSLRDDSSDFKLKNIIRIVDNKPFLNKAQLDLIDWASFYYCASPSAIANIIIPDIPRDKKKQENISSNKTARLILKKKLVPIITAVLKRIEMEEKVLWQWDDYGIKLAVYIKLLEKFSREKQVMVIFSLLSDIEEFLKFLPAALRQKTALLRGDLPLGVYWRQWNKIRENKNGIIIGTRQAIFAPAGNPGLIIVDDEHNICHKQWDQNPRYHALKTAQTLQTITGAKLLIASHTPNLTTWMQAKKENYKIIREAGKKIEESAIVNMQEEWKKGNHRILSEKAIDAFKTALSKQKKILVYVNRLGSAKLILCRDCGYIPYCPNCLLSLNCHESKSGIILKCHHCGYSIPQRIPCPMCGGAKFKSMGTGTEKAEKEIKRIFPAIRIARIDSEIDDTSDILSAFSLRKIDILVGTKNLLSHIFERDISIILALNIDTDLQIANFRGIEETVQTINGLHALLAKDGELIIQTYSQSQLSELFQNYSDLELRHRKKFNYPPYSQLIKLIYKSKLKDQISNEMEKIFSFLRNRFKEDKKIGLLGPITLPMKHGKYEAEIIIKNNHSHDFLQRWLTENMPNDWIIDIDPVEI